jgi:hypothetical protein
MKHRVHDSIAVEPSELFNNRREGRDRAGGQNNNNNTKEEKQHDNNKTTKTTKTIKFTFLDWMDFSLLGWFNI